MREAARKRDVRQLLAQLENSNGKPATADDRTNDIILRLAELDDTFDDLLSAHEYWGEIESWWRRESLVRMDSREFQVMWSFRAKAETRSLSGSQEESARKFRELRSRIDRAIVEKKYNEAKALVGQYREEATYRLFEIQRELLSTLEDTLKELEHVPSLFALGSSARSAD